MEYRIKVDDVLATKEAYRLGYIDGFTEGVAQALAAASDALDSGLPPTRALLVAMGKVAEHLENIQKLAEEHLNRDLDAAGVPSGDVSLN